MPHKAVVAILAVTLVSIAGCSRESVAPAPGATTGESTRATPGEPQPETAVSAEPAPSAERPATRVGDMMPQYRATWLNGKEFQLSQYRGTAVLVNVWATWCPPCREEIPLLQKIHRTHAAKGLTVLGVSVDDASAADDVRQFVAKQKIEYPIVLDPAGEIADMFRTSALPISAIIDRDGRIVWMAMGIIEETDPKFVAGLRKAMSARS